jgi:hypothetical protein
LLIRSRLYTEAELDALTPLLINRPRLWCILDATAPASCGGSEVAVRSNSARLPEELSVAL